MNMHDGYFSDYEEPDSWQNMYDSCMADYMRANSLKNAMEFQQSMLGVDKSEEIGSLEEITCAMEQIINPITRKLHEGIIFFDSE